MVDPLLTQLGGGGTHRKKRFKNTINKARTPPEMTFISKFQKVATLLLSI